jgi:hypothetical protein
MKGTPGASGVPFCFSDVCVARLGDLDAPRADCRSRIARRLHSNLNCFKSPRGLTPWAFTLNRAPTSQQFELLQKSTRIDSVGIYLSEWPSRLRRLGDRRAVAFWSW